MEIKFRGKSKEENKENEFIYGYYCYIGHLKQQKHYLIPDYASAFYGIEIIPETIGQYINRNDINGKEIYVGDIVKVKDNYLKGREFTGVVDFSDCSFMIRTSIGCNYRWRDYYNVEVIGNIFDNKEMLEEIL